MASRLSKQEILRKLLIVMEEECERAVLSAEQARSGSVHEDAVAKSKYETQSTELSYLANGQSARAHHLAGEVAYLKKVRLRTFSDNDPIAVTALVCVGLENLQWYFIVDAGGGTKIHLHDQEIVVLNSHSPFGSQLIGLYIGDEVPAIGKGLVREVLEIY